MALDDSIRFEVARPDIEQYFDESESRVFRLKDLSRILDQNRSYWRLTRGLSARRFVDMLIEFAHLRKHQFSFPSRTETVYAWGEVQTLELVNTIKPQAYFSHYTAMHLHGLTDQLPKNIYLSFPQTRMSLSDGSLSQDSIDLAFKRDVRVSKNTAEYGDFRITLLNPMGTDRLGIEQGRRLENNTIRYTDLERTLIDITVRPVYSGGVDEVITAYRRASANLSVNRLRALLAELDYVYPYHQAIGFYLERSGAYSADRIELFRALPREFDFYLSHRIEKPVYVQAWRLFVPEHIKL